MGSNAYQARQFNLSNLKGISDETLEMHFKLYEGYVKETNKLNEKIAEFIKDAKVDQDDKDQRQRKRLFIRKLCHAGELPFSQPAGCNRQE